MIPLKTVNDLINKHASLEKELSSEEIDKKSFAEKSKEYADLNEIIQIAKFYISFEKNKKEIQLILEDKNSDLDMIKMAENELIDLERISSEFESLIGKHKWPVSSGFISNKFGEHAHPVIKSIKVKNDGIDIQTNKSSKVYSIYDGKVSTIAFIPGMSNVVIINHGNYFTLYAKLKNLKIEKNQIIYTGDQIGDLITNSEGTTELQFQVWKNNVKLNPENWIIKK